MRLAHDTGEIIGMTIDEMSKMIKSEIKNQLDLINNDFNNASVLIEEYALVCKRLIEDKKKRISFWEGKADNKFQ